MGGWVGSFCCLFVCCLFAAVVVCCLIVCCLFAAVVVVVVFWWISSQPSKILNYTTTPPFSIDPSGWWQGKVNDREGLFPANYVEEIAGTD